MKMDEFPIRKLSRNSKERLLKVAELLENFNQTRKELCTQSDERVRELDMEHWNCGTTACAVGTAALHPWFRRRGLSIPNGYPIYKNHMGLYAAEKFFDIEAIEARFLFLSSYYPERTGPKRVAKRIRDFVADPSIAS